MNKVFGFQSACRNFFVGAVCLTSATAFAQQEYFTYSSFSAATSAPTIVNFDNVAAGTLLSPTAYAGLSISARRIAVVNPQDFAPGLTVGGQNVNSQPNGISASIFYSGASLVFDNENDNFTFTLSTPSSAAGLWLGNIGASNNDPTTPTTITFFSSIGQALASEVITQGHLGQIGSGANNRFFYGLVSTTPIASFTVINASNDGDGIIIDDVQWAAVVPEISSATMFALGLLALARTRRRDA